MPVCWIYSTGSAGQEIEGTVNVIVVSYLAVDKAARCAASRQ